MRIKKGFKLREVCGENVVTAEGMENINFNKLICLNETAAFLWKQLEGRDFTKADAAKALVAEYEIDMETASRDAASLCEAWVKAGVVE